MTTTPEQIVLCLVRDYEGDLEAAARYAERIGTGMRFNPWADPADSHNYLEAARRLRSEISDLKSEISHL